MKKVARLTSLIHRCPDVRGDVVPDQVAVALAGPRAHRVVPQEALPRLVQKAADLYFPSAARYIPTNRAPERPDRICGGTSEIMKNIIARDLAGLRA